MKSINNKSILVTGGTGFFGKKFIQTILNRIRSWTAYFLKTTHMKKSHELYDATWSEDEQEITEHLDLSFNTSIMDVIVLTLETMLGNVFARPQMRGRYVRKISVELCTSNSHVWKKTLVMRLQKF